MYGFKEGIYLHYCASYLPRLSFQSELIWWLQWLEAIRPALCHCLVIILTPISLFFRMMSELMRKLTLSTPEVAVSLGYNCSFLEMVNISFVMFGIFTVFLKMNLSALACLKSVRETEWRGVDRPFQDVLRVIRELDRTFVLFLM